MPRFNEYDEPDGQMMAVAQDAANDVDGPELSGERPIPGHGIPPERVEQAFVACAGYAVMVGTCVVAYILQVCR